MTRAAVALAAVALAAAGCGSDVAEPLTRDELRAALLDQADLPGPRRQWRQASPFPTGCPGVSEALARDASATAVDAFAESPLGVQFTERAVQAPAGMGQQRFFVAFSAAGSCTEFSFSTRGGSASGTVEPLLLPALGDDSFGLRHDGEVVGNGNESKLSMDVAYIRRGDVFLVVSRVEVESRAHASQLEPIARAALAKLDRALGR